MSENLPVTLGERKIQISVRALMWAMGAVAVLALGVFIGMSVGHSTGVVARTGVDSVAMAPNVMSPGGTPDAESMALRSWRIATGFKSLWFTTVPLTLSTLAFLIVIYIKGRSEYEPFFGQGQLAQLLVIILVVGNVCSLAIMDVLQKSEVSAIYGGVVGYVLGRQLGKSPATTTQQT